MVYLSSAEQYNCQGSGCTAHRYGFGSGCHVATLYMQQLTWRQSVRVQGMWRAPTVALFSDSLPCHCFQPHASCLVLYIGLLLTAHPVQQAAQVAPGLLYTTPGSPCGQ
jgi:hypothetical protein